MADGRAFAAPLTPSKPAGIRNRLMASPRFQKWAARFPLTRGLVKKEGAALFDLIAGFCHSQVLMALAELQIPEALIGGSMDVDELAAQTDIPTARMDILLQAGAAIGILKRKGPRVSLTRRGAAFATVPGLSAMVRHHRAFYRDLSDPVAFFRGEIETELASVWPYVFGNPTGIDGATALAYSELMAQSQALVAEDTLRMVQFKDTKILMDVGGGTGAFLTAVGRAYSNVHLRLFDLPAVAPAAADRFDAEGMVERSDILSGSFRNQDLPEGADTISLIRVLYDHSDETVQDLLAKAYRALPRGGRIVISEPMSGGSVPDKATDGYFALYTLAMQTGRTRSPQQIEAMLTNAGFEDIQKKKPLRSYVTSVVTAQKPS